MKIKKQNGFLRVFEDYEIEEEPFISTVKPVGNGARINCSSRFLNKKVLVAVLK